MKILNICEILPLDGLKRENDIAIKIQQEINKIDDSIEFVFLKSIPYSNFLLAKIKPIWAKYNKYIKLRETIAGGYKTIIFPWFRLPTSKFVIDKNLLIFNKLLNLKKVENMLGEEIKTFDLIISQNNIADGVVANYLSKKYTIPHIHVFRGQLNEEIYNSKIINDIMTNANICITPSPTSFNFLKKRNHNISLFPHGVDEEYFYDKEKDFSKAKFVTVARLLKLKNIDMVINSLKSAKEMGYDFEYIIIGDGPEKLYLEKLVRDLQMEKEIKFTGWLEKDEVIKYLQVANVFIMPSIPETLGRVYLEATAAGCLCIGHKGSGIDGFFADRKSAIFSDAATINDDILEVLKGLSGDDIQNYTNSAKELVKQLHWKEVSHKYIELFRKVPNK
ncbi:glycosyltransferase [Sulfurovum sp. CS9]|uniref:glycosyltransferase n=1 Tax=Sulfurovum sp. CS9 TaxID=3391146 RepID=UPI0039ED2111